MSGRASCKQHLAVLCVGHNGRLMGMVLPLITQEVECSSMHAIWAYGAACTLHPVPMHAGQVTVAGHHMLRASLDQITRWPVVRHLHEPVLGKGYACRISARAPRPTPRHRARSTKPRARSTSFVQAPPGRRQFYRIITGYTSRHSTRQQLSAIVICACILPPSSGHPS
jgi:hypothetical protein